jgi:hypothetical protein
MIGRRALVITNSPLSHEATADWPARGPSPAAGYSFDDTFGIGRRVTWACGPGLSDSVARKVGLGAEVHHDHAVEPAGK